MNNSSVETIGCFKTILDPYNGITIDKNDLPHTKEEFEVNLDYLIGEVENKRNLIWIYIDIKNSDFIPVATKKGFFFHSCEEDYTLLVRRLIPDAIVPTAANHTVGVGAVVINDNNEILVIKEKISTIGYKLPGGHIDNGEMISNAVVREVYEETGIKVNFDSIISLGHFYPHQFHKSNLYILCICKARTLTIDIKDTKEIVDAKWVDVNEYIQDENVLEYSRAIVKTALEQKGFISSNTETLAHINRNFEIFFPNKS
jgi:8-oxo-dGTP diphosphatase